MESSAVATRRNAINSAIANSALSGFHPTEFGKSVYEHWIIGRWTTEEAIALLKKHHIEQAQQNPNSDGQAKPNKMGITDSVRLKQVEADLSTLRMAQLESEW